MKKRILIIIIVSFTLFACKKNVHITEPNSNGRSTMIINGVTRSFYTKVPQDYNPQNKYPLIIYLHAAGETAVDVLKVGFTEKAHENGYIIVYPSGLGGNWKLYNDTDKGNSDVKFISSVIDVLSREYNLDQKRIYASGRSLGGFMSYQLAFKLPKKIAAISVLSGSVFPENIPKKQKPMAIQHIHALNDNMIPYNQASNQVYPIPDLINYWINKNQADKSGEVFFNENGIVGRRYSSEKSNKTVELITHTLGGHGNLPLSPDFVISFFNNNQ